MDHVIAPTGGETDAMWPPEQAFVFLAQWSPIWRPYIHLLIREYKNWAYLGTKTGDKFRRIQARLHEVTLRLHIKQRHARIGWCNYFDDDEYDDEEYTGYGESGLCKENRAARMRDNKLNLAEMSWRIDFRDQQVDFDGAALRISKLSRVGPLDRPTENDQIIILTKAGVQSFGLMVYPWGQYSTLGLNVDLRLFRQWFDRRRRRKRAQCVLDRFLPPVLNDIVRQYI